MAKTIDLLDVLSDDERSQLSDEIAAKADAEEQKKAERIARLQKLGFFDEDETTVDWVPQETVTLWRKWTCTCGSCYEGPAYDSNPTYVRYEKMRVRFFNPGKREWQDLREPKPMGTRPSIYRRAEYQHGLPHRIEVQETQLWSCPKCKTQAITPEGLARPWNGAPIEVDGSFESPGVPHVACLLDVPEDNSEEHF